MPAWSLMIIKKCIKAKECYETEKTDEAEETESRTTKGRNAEQGKVKKVDNEQ